MKASAKWTSGLAITALAVVAAVYVIQSSGTPDPFQGIYLGNGRVEGTEFKIAAKYPGRIVEIGPQEGDDVEKDAVVVRLDDREARARLAEARAERDRAVHVLHSAKAEIERRKSDEQLAKSQLDRTIQLAEKDNVSQQRKDQDKAALEAATAALEGARAAVMEAEALLAASEARVDLQQAILSETEIHAPVGGRVLFRVAEPGELISAGSNILLLVDLDRLYMTVYLDERSAGTIRIGDEARVWLDAYPGRPFAARVSFISSEAEFTPKEVQTAEERQNLVFRAKISLLDNKERLLKPGMPGIGLVRTNKSVPWPQSMPRQ